MPSTQISSVQQSLFLNGEWINPSQQSTHVVDNPATGEAIAEIGYGNAEDALKAIDAAQDAFKQWSRVSARERANILNKVSDLLRQRSNKIGEILAAESGKRIEEAIGEVKFSAEYFQWFAEEIRRPDGQVIPSDSPTKTHFTYQQPAGVAVLLTPWNFPISIQARKLAPALAAGCTIVARGSQYTPLSVIELFKCLEDAGMPPGVVNLVHGPATEMTKTLLTHPSVRVASFTGSTEIGQKIINLSSEQVLRLSLELGGNAPFIVFDDADIDKAVQGAMIAKFRNNGQSCIGANRFYVHENIYEKFVSAFKEEVVNMSIGDPFSEYKPDLGPMINLKGQQRMEEIIQTAKNDGSKITTSQYPLPNSGYFVKPTIIENPRNELGDTEIFGPIALIYSFKDDDEVIEYANATDMGLAGYAYTSNIYRSRQIQENLDVGILGINSALPSVVYAPMGGMKKSGIGREGGRVGLEEYMETKYVASEY